MLVKVFPLLIGFCFIFLSENTFSEEKDNHRYDLSIAQQNVEDALHRLAKQTGKQLFFSYDVIETLESNTLAGKYTLEQALEKMLKGTGISGRLTKTGVIIVTPENKASSTNAGEERDRMKTKKNLLASVIGFFVGAGGASGVYAQASDSAENSLVMEEVVVSASSYRESLKKAIDMKRDGVGFSDSIVATDIADFPDQNLAEALQRIPGVAIDRNRGLGERVNIRSLGSQFTHTTINNIATASGSGGREVDFSIFASELIQSVSVNKSPTAADEEGGVAGVVSIKTAQPFDYDGFKLVGSVEATDNSSSEETDPRYAFLISDTFADDTWGALFSYASGDRTIRSDEMYVDEFFSLGDRLYDRNDAGTDATTPANLDPDIIYPEKIQDSTNLIQQEVWGATASVQFRPTESLELAFDVMLGGMDEQVDTYLHDTYTGPATSASNLTIDDFGMITAGTFENALQEFKTYRDQIEKEFTQVGFTADWQVGDWDIDGLLGYNKAERHVASDYFKWATTDHNLIYNLEGRYFSRSSSTFDPLQNADAGFSNYDLDVTDVTNDKKVVELNFKRLLDVSILPAMNFNLSSVQFGVRYSEKSVENEYGYTRVKGDTLTENPDGTISTSEEYVNQPMSLVGAQLLSDILPGGGYQGDGVKDWLAGSVDAALAYYIPSSRRVPVQFRPNSYYQVDEDVLSLYAMGDFDFDIGALPSQLNIGVRYVTTDQSSYGYKEETDAPPTRVGFSTDYDDVLPSLNLRVNLMEDLLLRFAVAKVMSRAQLRDLSGSLSVSEVNGTIKAGNPDLEPLRADQVDLSLEWYFSEEALMAVTLFKKDLDSVISEDENGTMVYQGNTYDLTTKVNVEGIDLEGVELIFQMPFTFLPGALDGLGVNMNYTYVDATRGKIEGTNREIPMFGL
jgi:iron complex outermembrane recepter protein